jgi:hypothetical protein
MNTEKKKRFYIAVPCYNDWDSLTVLFENINSENAQHGYDLRFVVVNDGSQLENTMDWTGFKNISEIVQIDLFRNVGHQSAISIALAYINEEYSDYQGVVVMDSDGEDDFRDVFRFIENFEPNKILFAKRKKRSESLFFKTFYNIYKFVFKLLTDKILMGGNFSLIPTGMLNKVVHTGEIWNHYHAGILKSRLTVKYIDCDRAERYKGKSKMNFVSLVTHGLSSISVFNNIVFVRLTIFSIIFFIFSMAGIAAVLYLKFVMHKATPGWSSTVIGTLLILCVQFMLMVISSTFTTLGNKNLNSFSLLKEYKSFIMNILKHKQP